MEGIVTTTFEDLKRMGHPSVTDYCRELMQLNPERYAEMSVEIRRGETVCLTVRSVKEGSELEPDPSYGFRRYRKDRRRGST